MLCNHFCHRHTGVASVPLTGLSLEPSYCSNLPSRLISFQPTPYRQPPDLLTMTAIDPESLSHLRASEQLTFPDASKPVLDYSQKISQFFGLGSNDIVQICKTVPVQREPNLTVSKQIVWMESWMTKSDLRQSCFPFDKRRSRSSS